MSIVEKLRDPIWQAWGTLVGLLALLISTFVAYDVSSRDSRNSTYLTIYDGYSYQLFSGKKPENIIVSVDDTPINSVGIYRTSIRNTGLTAIRPEDFIEPIRITLKTIPYHLLSVDIGQISPSELDVKWTQITTNTFELKPLLLYWTFDK